MMRAASAIALSVACLGLAGCETFERTGFLWKQGPGNAPDGKVQPPAPKEAAQTQPQAAPPPQTSVPARKLDVAADLVASAPVPPPRSAAAESPANTAMNAYTQSTKYGDMLFISGQIPLDLRTNVIYDNASVQEQTRVVMENIRMILEANRLTMANVVSTTVYLKDVNTMREMNAVYDTYFRGSPPARTIVEVSKLPRGVALQISAVAGR